MASKDQSIVLITGANGGIGFELAAQLLPDPSYFVLLGCRSSEKGESAVKQLKERNLPGTVELLHIDVSNEDSIKKAAETVKEKYGCLDALINNAAISGDNTEFTLTQSMQAAFLTNTTGPAIVVEEFASLLEKSEKIVRIVNVSSGAGSISSRLNYENEHQKMKLLPYRTSKSALNMLTVCQAYEYGPRGWKVFAFCPGFTESNLGPMNKVAYGAQPTSEGARGIVEVVKGNRDGEHGGFLKEGGVWPW